MGNRRCLSLRLEVRKGKNSLRKQDAAVLEISGVGGTYRPSRRTRPQGSEKNVGAELRTGVSAGDTTWGALVRGRDTERGESVTSPLELQGGKRQRPAWVEPTILMGLAEEEEEDPRRLRWGPGKKGKEEDPERV